jgi:hypothetical protein
LLEAEALESMRALPFLVVRRKGDGLETIGQPRALLGKPVRRNGVDEGIWTRWDWDGRRLEVRQDRFGFHPCFYFVTRDAWGVSPSIHVLVEHGAPTALDDDAIAVFLRLGYYLGTTTPFLAIRALPPGGHLEAEGLSLQVKVESDPRARPVRGVSVEAAVELYGPMFQAVIDRTVPTLPERTVVPLSGGRDSRHILFALHRAGFRNVTCPSVMLPPPLRSDDPVVAGVVARRLGFPFQRLGPIRSVPAAEAAKNVLVGMCTAMGAWIIPLTGWLQRHGAQARFDGVAGDVLSQFSGKNPWKLQWMLEGKFEDLARAQLPAEGYLPRLLSTEYRARWNRDAAVRLLAAEFARHADQPSPWHSWMLWNRTRRGIAAGWVQLGGPWDSYAPFLDHELYDLLGGLPGGEFFASQLHSRVLAASYPEWADLPFASKAWTPVSDRIFWLRQSAAVAWLVARTTGRPFFERSYLVTRLANAVGSWDRQAGAAGLVHRGLYLTQLAALANR